MNSLCHDKSHYGKNIKNVSKGHETLLAIDNNMNVKAIFTFIH